MARRTTINLLMVAILMTICAGCSKDKALENSSVDTQKNNVETKSKETEVSYNQFNTYVRWETDGSKKFMCLVNDNNEVLLKADYIYSDDVNSSRFLRFINNNKIGYANAASGEVIVNPKYVEASIIQYETAVVREKDNYYYINSTGKRLSKQSYDEAYPFAESQGDYARVKSKGQWQLLNKRGKVLLTASYINELPSVTETVTGIDTKGNAFTVFIEHGCLETKDNLESSKKTYEQFDYIEKAYMGECAIVRAKKSKLKGVINFCKDNYVIIEPKYEDIAVEKTFFENGDEGLVFNCTKPNGEIDIITK